jgi:crotonobetainyl-CoA:carnitine CoA-transferase CaiB-like acyl-CoA transferase
MTAVQLPLSGVKVVDLTRILSGPFCTMMLADMGADVVKVEGLDQGDPIRKLGTIVDGMSWYFAAFNRNKRSIALDLRSAEGRELLERMLAKADVLVENFRPGVLDEMGLTEARLKEINPRLVVASINGYGATGPYADRPAFDFVIQAMSGLMSVNGTPESGPLRSGPPITDILAGLYAAFGVVCALKARDHNQLGQRVEASMLGAVMSTFAYLASDHLATGKLPVATGNDHPITAPYGLFTASDGEIAVAPSTEAVLDRFLDAIGLGDLREDARFATNTLRLQHRGELNTLVNRHVVTDTQANWVRRLNEAGVPCALVQNLQQALSDPQVLHQQFVVEVEHPGHGPVKMIGFPVKLSDTPCLARRPAPGHGVHTQEVLQDWGIAQA